MQSCRRPHMARPVHARQTSHEIKPRRKKAAALVGRQASAKISHKPARTGRHGLRRAVRFGAGGPWLSRPGRLGQEVADDLRTHFRARGWQCAEDRHTRRNINQQQRNDTMNQAKRQQTDKGLPGQSAL